MPELTGFLVLALLLSGGCAGAAWAWRAFTTHQDDQEHARRLREVHKQPTPEQRAIDQAAVRAWADAKLRRIRRQRGARP